MIVQSKRGAYRATLTQEADGVRVVIDRCASVRFAAKQLCIDLVDAPLHVVVDHVEPLIQELEDKEWT